MKIHWHLVYTNKTACGTLAYPTEVRDEYNTATNGRIDCTDKPKAVTCLRCQKVMRLGKWSGKWTPSGAS